MARVSSIFCRLIERVMSWILQATRFRKARFLLGRLQRDPLTLRNQWTVWFGLRFVLRQRVAKLLLLLQYLVLELELIQLPSNGQDLGASRLEWPLVTALEWTRRELKLPIALKRAEMSSSSSGPPMLLKCSNCAVRWRN